MTNSTFKPRTKPMSRTSRKSSPFSLSDRKTWERKRKKPTVAEGSKYLDACRNECCYLKIPGVCRLREPDETCVPAHRNEGKGIGLKVSNELTLPACYYCHAEYDQGRRFTREEKREMWNDAYEEWVLVRARKMGIEQQELEVA